MFACKSLSAFLFQGFLVLSCQKTKHFLSLTKVFYHTLRQKSMAFLQKNQNLQCQNPMHPEISPSLVSPISIWLMIPLKKESSKKELPENKANAERCPEATQLV